MCLDLFKTLGNDLNDKRKDNCLFNILLKLAKKPEQFNF